MAIVQWSASPTGHYSENVVAISTSEDFYLTNGSYNDVAFTVSHIAVSAAGNSAITIVTFSDGSSFPVSPFTSSIIEVSGRESCMVANNGDADIKVTLMDMAHAKAYSSQYTQPPWQAGASLNTLLYHFTENPPKNFGSDTSAIAAMFPAQTVTTTNGKFTPGGFTTGDGGITSGIGFVFADLFDIGINASSWTIDFWIRPHGTQGTTGRTFLAGTDNAGALGNTNCLIGHNAGQWTMRGNNLAVGVFPPNNIWAHLAIVKRPGNTITYFYLNGILIGSTTAAWASTNIIYLMTNVAGTAANAGFSGDVSEFRITPRAVWLSNFTPPIAPYT